MTDDKYCSQAAMQSILHLQKSSGTPLGINTNYIKIYWWEETPQDTLTQT